MLTKLRGVEDVDEEFQVCPVQSTASERSAGVVTPASEHSAGPVTSTVLCACAVALCPGKVWRPIWELA